MSDTPTPGPRPAIVCVTSGKGGTGKSVLTSNLAVHLAASGVRVMAVDADMGLANLHLLLGMRPQKTVMEVIDLLSNGEIGDGPPVKAEMPLKALPATTLSLT